MLYKIFIITRDGHKLLLLTDVTSGVAFLFYKKIKYLYRRGDIDVYKQTGEIAILLLKDMLGGVFKRTGSEQTYIMCTHTHYQAKKRKQKKLS